MEDHSLVAPICYEGAETTGLVVPTHVNGENNTVTMGEGITHGLFTDVETRKCFNGVLAAEKDALRDTFTE